MGGELHYMGKGFAASQGFLSNAGTDKYRVYRFYTLRPTELIIVLSYLYIMVSDLSYICYFKVFITLWPTLDSITHRAT